MGGIARNIGTAGEDIARCYLEGKGLQFVTANWKCRAGEVDLIMRSGSTLVFTEVRVRSRTDFGEPYETVGRQKKRKILNSARWYQLERDYWGDIRFDVVSITMGASGNYTIDHVRHAFEE